VFLLMPYCRHSAANGTCFANALRTKSFRRLTIGLASHGIPRDAGTGRRGCHLCPEAETVTYVLKLHQSITGEATLEPLRPIIRHGHPRAEAAPNPGRRAPPRRAGAR